MEEEDAANLQKKLADEAANKKKEAEELAAK